MAVIAYFCNNCSGWYPESTWEEEDVRDGEGEIVEGSYLVCPRCGYHWPFADVPIREAREVPQETKNRWTAFSDEELADLYYGAVERRDTINFPPEIRGRAGRLVTEMSRDLRRRRREEQNQKTELGAVSELLDHSSRLAMDAIWASRAEVTELRRAVRALVEHLELA